MELQTKKFYLVWFARKKIAKSGDCTIASYMRKTQTIYSNFFKPKIFNFLCTIYSLSFNGKQFLFFVERGKNTRKKVKEVMGKQHGKQFVNFS
jgi:hypothetical protein